MSDRGMKKWAPFSSLIEQSTCLEEMRYQKNKNKEVVTMCFTTNCAEFSVTWLET